MTEDHRDPDSEIREDHEVNGHNVMELAEPKVGMMFDSEIQAQTFYATYARAKGFGVTISNSKKKNGIRYWVQFSCHKNRLPRKLVDPMASQPTTKTDCKATMKITRQFDDQWKVTSIKLEHNHEMDPKGTKYLRCYRNIPAHIQRKIELNYEAGMRINKIVDILQQVADDNDDQSWTEKDLRNHMDKVRRSAIKGGDAQAMMLYFQKMQADNNNFFYSIDIDDENCLTKVFWADARSREAYKEFGDVVTFDTTYLVNRFNMPFAPFVGVNHHGHSILLGCGLVTQENTESFVWLFKAWLTCMSGVPPHGIITDQDRAMQNAISLVFPYTRHRWCLWHIMKKVPDKFKSYKDFEQIQNAISSAVYDSYTVSDFEKNWTKMIIDHKLEDHEWLCPLYDERNRWVPTFVTDTFWAGMSTTQRSESMNSFFKGYVYRKTSLKEFVEKYEIALRKKVKKEEEADANSKNSQYPQTSVFDFENQFHDAYTVNKFKQFRRQLHKLINCELEVGVVVDGIEQYMVEHTFKAGTTTKFNKTVKFLVRFDERTGETNCICRMFESKGMVCVHMLRVWKLKKLSLIPEKYILHRWRKNIVRSHTKVILGYTKRKRKDEWRRYDEVLGLLNEAADGVIFSESMTNKLKDTLVQFIEVNKEQFLNKMPSRIPKSIDVSTSEDETLEVGDPSQGLKKGRPERKRKVSKYEKEAKKKKKQCTSASNKQANTKKPTKNNKSKKKMQELKISQKSVTLIDLNEPAIDS